MAIVEFRNAYYRGWFAARARRPTPEPDMLEEFFFIDAGFSDGLMSPGGPLELWSRDILPGMPANLDGISQPDEPVFTTRRPEAEPAPQPAREAPQPPVLEDAVEPAAEAASSAFSGGSEDGERPAQLPEKKPSYSLPSRPAYGGGVKAKRRAVRFKG